MSTATVAEADTYFGSRLHAEAWTLISDSTLKQKALNSADDILLNLPLIENTPEQVKKDACCLIAISLLDAIDPNIEFANLTQTNLTLGGTRTASDPSEHPEHILYGVPSIQAWRLLKPYINDPCSITLCRV
jgi:hypothetical protein